MFDEIKCLYAFTKYTVQKFIAKPQYINELILTLFSLFDIKCKKTQCKKNPGNVFLGHLSVSCSYFLKVVLNHVINRVNSLVLYFTVIIAKLEQKNAGWVWVYIVSDSKFVSNNCDKFIDLLWTGNICWATCFHPYSSKMKWRKDNFSRAFSSSSLHAIITRNHLAFFKLFSNFVHFYPNFQIFYLFLPILNIFLYHFCEKLHFCPYFLE